MRNDNLHRAVWRWHFFAGLIVLPILAWMAITGALYLYKAELERALFPALVETGSTSAPLPVSELIRITEARTGGTVSQVAAPAAPGESWRLALDIKGAGERLAFVRPDNGILLGTSRPGGPLELIKELHSLAVAGSSGSVVVEIVAGWAVVMVLTGFYLWWPRAGSRALSLAGRIGERRFWRNIHASAGAVVGAVILFLALTGMPWTIFWGAQFHALVANADAGRPPPPPGHGQANGHDKHLPWSLHGSPAPQATLAGDVGPDAAVAAAATHGLRAPWVLDLPDRPGRPYRLATPAERTGDVRMLYVDPSDAKILQDTSFEDFGIGAKIFEWGIYTHQGQQYGEANRLVMLGGCIGLLLLALSAPLMWRKRRRGPGLSPPPRAQASPQIRGAMVLMLAIGLLFPLTGATMLVAQVVGRLWPRSSSLP